MCVVMLFEVPVRLRQGVGAMIQYKRMCIECEYIGVSVCDHFAKDNANYIKRAFD